MLVKDGDIGFLCAPNGAQKLCAPNGAQMGHKMGHKMGCRGLKSKNYTIIEFNENLKILGENLKSKGVETKNPKLTLNISKYFNFEPF